MKKWFAAAGTAAVLLVFLAAAGLRAASKRPSYCGWCHVMAPYYGSWTASEFLARRHALAGVDCHECHPKDLRQLVHEIIATVRRSYEVPLPGLKATKEQCLRCHGDYASLVRATSGLKVNPHASHLGEEECRQCHKMHRESQGLKLCFTCHHSGDLVPCRNCHKGR